MTDARDRLRRPSPVAVALSAGLAAELALHFLEPRLAITCSHALLGRRGALVRPARAARRRGRTPGEAGAIALVAWTAFGVAQLVPGYLDVYPFALAVTALYLWTALGTLAGDVHPGWPLVIAFLAPFFYIGLVLLVPSTDRKS